jgi:hypothetical protein
VFARYGGLNADAAVSDIPESAARAFETWLEVRFADARSRRRDQWCLVTADTD